MPATVRSTWFEAGALTALALVLRAATLGLQSYDFDESFTVSAVHRSFPAMLHAVARTESTPPLYYVLAWAWAQLFGTGEVALRSFSALAGAATVPVVYVLGRSLASRRVGLTAAALVATSPYLIFYSQEARSYALFALLSTVGAVCCVRVLNQPGGRAFTWWAAASAAAIATHYFAFLVWLGEVAVLAVFGAPRRALVLWSALIAAATAPLLLLARHQAGAGHVDWIGASSLPQRLRVTVESFALGATFRGSLPHGVLAACAVLAVVLGASMGVAAWLLLRTGPGPEWRAAAIAGVIAATAVALTLAGAAVHKDYLLHKNLIPVVPLCAVALAAGLGGRAAGRLGVAAAAVAVSAGAALTILAFAAPSLRRPDVRQVSDRLGTPTAPRIVILVPRWRGLLDLYQGPSEDLPAGGRRVAEIDVFTIGSELPAGTVPRAFRLVRQQGGTTFTLFRFRASAPVLVTPSDLGHQRFRESGLEPIAVVEAPGAA